MSTEISNNALAAGVGEVLRDLKLDLDQKNDILESRVNTDIQSAHEAVDDLRTELSLKGQMTVQLEKTLDGVCDQMAMMEDRVQETLKAQKADLQATLDEKVKNLDGNLLVRSLLVETQQADVLAASKYLSDLVRRSERTSSSGLPAKHISKALDIGIKK